MARASSATTALLFCASLALNGLLAARLFRPVPSLPGVTVRPETGRHLPGRDLVPIAAQPTLAPAPATNAPPPFLWNQIESADYREYIANLRAVGCPEQIIGDLIAAELNQLYAPRAATIWKMPAHQYWQKWSNQNPGPDQMKALEALRHEKAGVYHELLGTRQNEQQLIDTLYLQVHGSEQELLFLPEDKRQAALQALEDAGFEEKEMKLQNEGRYYEKEPELYKEKTALLAKLLSPEELDEFKLRTSGAAQSLRNEVQYFNLSPDEFKALVNARAQDEEGKASMGDLLNRGPAVEEVRKLLGDERAKEFERVSDLFYINARRAAEDHGLPREQAEAAWQVTYDARAAADKLAKNSGLDNDERQRQIQAIEQQAEKSLEQLLGKNVSSSMRRDLRNVLRNPRNTCIGP